MRMTPATLPERRDLVSQLANRVDWRQAVEALDLSDWEARDLRIAIVRRRCFGDGATRSQRRPRGRP